MPQLGDANSPIRQIDDYGRKNVVTPGTAVQLSTSDIACTLVEVLASPGNTKPVIIGGSGVVLGAGPSYSTQVGSGILFPGQTRVYAVTNVNLLYLDAEVAGEGVTFAVLK